MFDQSIKTFMQVVSCGSFSKAAEAMFLTPNAIKKRILTLESQTGVLLFHRTNKGVILTKAGEALYKDFQILNEQYERSVQQALSIQNRSDDILCIGMMTTFSDSFTTCTWNEAQTKTHNQPIHIIYYEDTPSQLEAFFKDAGTKTSLCIDIFDPAAADRHGLMAQKISEFPLYIGMRERETPESAAITFDALAGHTLAMPRAGRAVPFDKIRLELRSQYPEIQIKDIPDYNIRTLHQCYEQGDCVLITENHLRLYPHYAFYKLMSERSVSFGVYYSYRHRKKVLDFIDKILPTETAR